MATTKNRLELKASFKKNSIPTENDFVNLIEAGFNQADDGIRKSEDGTISIKGQGTNQELLAFYKSFEDKQTPAWKINQNAGGKAGLNIAMGNGTSRLFIDENTGELEVSGKTILHSEVVTGNGLTVNGDAFMRKKLTVDGLLDAKGDATVANKLTTAKFEVSSDAVVNGKLVLKSDVLAINLKEKGIIKWGDGNVVANEHPGLYSTGDGRYMKFGTKKAPIMFYSTKAAEDVGIGAPNMVIHKDGDVGIGTIQAHWDTENDQNNAVTLQIGDTTGDATVPAKHRSGQLILAKYKANNGGNRAFRIGLNDGFNFSIGDLGYKGQTGRKYTEFFTIDCNSGKIFVKKDLEVTDSAFVKKDLEVTGSVDVKENFKVAKKLTTGNVIHIEGTSGSSVVASVQGGYITWNKDVGVGKTTFINHKGHGTAGGFRFENTSGSGTTCQRLVDIDENGNFDINKELYKNKGWSASDVRVKANISTTDAAKDLALLNRLRLTDYDYLRNGKQNERDKGVIAQELQQLIPEAVRITTNFTADIFAAPAKIAATGDDLLFTMSQPHHLADGNLVRFILPQGDTEKLVTVVDDKTFIIEGTMDDFKDSLVYGKQVDDFMRVNYEHLFTLNLSATQELSRKIDALLAWKALCEKNMVLAD